MKRCFCLVILLFSLLCAGCAAREAPYLEPLPEEEQATFITSDLHGDFRYALPEGSAESFSVYAELWEDGALVRTLPLATLGEATGEAVPMSLDIIFSGNAGEIYCGVDCSQGGFGDGQGGYATLPAAFVSEGGRVWCRLTATEVENLIADGGLDYRAGLVLAAAGFVGHSQKRHTMGCAAMMAEPSRVGDYDHVLLIWAKLTGGE